MIIRCYSDINERVCLSFYPCKEIAKDLCIADLYENNRLMVFLDDYHRLLLPYLESVFPLKSLNDGEMQRKFDECWNNWIDKASWQTILTKIKARL